MIVADIIAIAVSLLVIEVTLLLGNPMNKYKYLRFFFLGKI